MGSVKKVILDCLGKTSIKGIPRIIQHNAVSLRVLWLAGVVGLGGMATFTLIRLMVAYLSFTTTTTISERFVFDKEGLSGMMLVVCNKQPISGTGLNNSGDIIPFNQYMEMIEAEIPKSEDTQELLDDLSSYSGYYQYIGKENATRLGHQRDTFIADCRMLYASTSTTIKRRKCQMEKIQLVSNPRFYNCYKMPVLDTEFTAGIPVGLSLLLYMDRPQQNKLYVADDLVQSGGISMSLGFSDIIHDFFFRSFDVRPGEATTARMRVKERTLAPEPYSTCIGINDVKYNDFDGKNLSYSLEACVNACLQDVISTTCNCTDPELLVIPSSGLMDKPFCKGYSGDAKQLLFAANCLDTAVRANTWLCGYELCPPACKSVSYPVSLSTSEWPEQTHLLSLYHTVIAQNRHKYKHEFGDYEILERLIQSGNHSSLEEELLTKFLQKNFAKVTVVMSSIYATVLKEVPTMTWDTLLSQVGGTLNLYSGISLIVFVEMLELLHRLIGSFFTATEASSKKRSTRVSAFSN